jgi:hypothetical protein
MPSILSTLRDKLLLPEWTFAFNCYEIGHTWTPHCTDAALDMGFIVLQQAVPMYTGLYILSHFVSAGSLHKLIDHDALRMTASSILRSSLFLGFNTFAMITTFCLLRKVTGKFYYSICATVPAFVGSIIAIQIERPTRRAALSFYLANIASECIFRMAADRNYIPALPHGEVILFTVSMMILLHCIKKKGFGHDPVSMALRFLLGTSEARRVRFEDQKGSNICGHRDECTAYVSRGFIKPFVAGWMAQSALLTLPQIHVPNPRKMFATFGKNMLSWKSVQFGLFLGSFCSIYKGINCYLRQREGCSQEWHNIAAALVAGPSMIWSPNSTVTLYLTWKMIETCFFIGVDKGLVKNPMDILCCMYAASVGVIFYTGVLEPGKLRGSYTKFIDRVTQHRLHLLNRNLLDVFGTGASVGYEDYFPDLVPSLCSHAFMETVFIWMI